MTDPSSVTGMFDGIAPRYDDLNHLLSFGIDRIWRRKASKLVAQQHPKTILDVATGTADLALRLAKDNPDAIVIGVDLSTEMLHIGQRKIQKEKLVRQVRLETADAMSLPFSDDSFDAVTAAFGVRNFGDCDKGLREMVRVCHQGGLVAVLEFSHPTNVLVKAPYRWYSQKWIPWLGGKVSKHPNAYSYLPSSVEAFPSGAAFVTKLEQSGLREVQSMVFSGGIATLYYGYKPKNNASPQ